MWPVLSFLRRRGADILAVLFMLFCLITLTGPVVHAGHGRDARCVYNVGLIATGLLGYVEDYDERMPYAMNDYAKFQQILTPYVRDTTAFSCPATQNSPYKPDATLANVFTTTFPNLDTKAVLRDSRSHPDRRYTVAFADGHVERGGQEQTLPLPDTTCHGHIVRIASALEMYAQDNDGVYPPYRSDNDLRRALQPYVRSNRTWYCPDSIRLYTISKDMRGKTKLDFPDLSPVVEITDPVEHRSGITSTMYLDRYFEQRNATGVTFPPASFDSTVRIRRMTLDYRQYIKDHNGHLPVYNSFDDLVPLLFPYRRSSREFLSPGAKPFQVNLAISGTLLSDYPYPHDILLFEDPNLYDGRLQVTVSYLDGSLGFIYP